MPFFKGHLVRSVGQRQIEAGKTERGPALSPRSWNVKVVTLKQIFAYAKSQLRVLIDNPADSLHRKKEGKAKILVASKEQFRVRLTEPELLQVRRTRDVIGKQSHEVGNGSLEGTA